MDTIDIIPNSSRDVPYSEFPYKEAAIFIQQPEAPINGTVSQLHCTKIYTKKFEDMTYFKVEFHCEIEIKSEKEVEFYVAKEDGYAIRVRAKIRDNIVEIPTDRINWAKWELTSTQPDWNKVLDELNRISRPPMSQPIINNPIWIPDRDRGSSAPNPPWLGQPSITYGDGHTRVGYSSSTGANVRVNGNRVQYDTVDEAGILREYATDLSKILILGEYNNGPERN